MTSDTPMTTRENRRWDQTRVLMYHRVVQEPDSRSPWTVKANLFRGHLEFLQRHGFSTITLREYAAALENNLALPLKPIILTFDDGYVDFADVVLPILKDYGMKAVVFAVVDPPKRYNCWDSGSQDENAPLMENHHLQKVHHAGCEIGSHTLTHPRLTQLGETEMWQEVSKSRSLLEEKIGAPVTSFCYPFGLLNDTAKALVIE